MNLKIHAILIYRGTLSKLGLEELFLVFMDDFVHILTIKEWGFEYLWPVK